MANPTDYLLGYWELDDATDAHTGGHDLTESGTVTYTAGEGADLGTSNGFLYIPNASAGAFQLGLDNQSWYFEFKYDAAPAADAVPIVRFGWRSPTDTNDDGFGFLVSSANQLLLRFSDGTTPIQVTLGGTYTTATWYKVRLTFHRTGLMRAYVNGILQGSASISAYSAISLAATNDLTIGGLRLGRYFDGRIRRVAAFAGMMSGYLEARLLAGDDYADLSAITAAYPTQEFIAIGTGSNVVAQSVGVSDLIEGQVALVLQSIDGNSTSHTLTAWDGAWSQIIDEVATQLGTAFCRLRGWWKVVTATDVSSVTQAATAWSSSQEATLIVQLWDNCAGVNIDGATANTATSTSHTAPAVTTTVDGCTILGVLAVDAATVISSTDADLTRSGEDGRNGTGSVVVWHGTQFQATAGSTGTYSFTTTDPESAIAATIAMEPAAAGTVTADLALTDGADQIDAAASPFVDAAITLTDGADELAIVASPFVNVTLSLTDGADQIAAEVTVVDNTITVSLALVDGADLIEALGGPVVNAALTLVDGADIIAAAGGALVTASVTLTDGADVIAAILSDPNNTIRDIELSARPLVGITLTATPLMQITLTARPHVE